MAPPAGRIPSTSDVLSPAWGPFSPASLGKGTPGCSDGTKSACMPVPLGIRPQLVPAFGTRCKMQLFEVLLFGAARSAGVQNATFAGVFVPQDWNQQAYQSASRICPVEVRLHLYHRVPGSCQLSFRSSNSCTRLRHRRRAPNSRAPKDGACKAPPSAHYFRACCQRDSMTARTTLSPSTKRSPTAARNASGFLAPPHSSPPHLVQMRTTAPSIASSMNSLTRAYLEPLGSLRLNFSAGTRTAEQAAPPLVS